MISLNLALSLIHGVTSTNCLSPDVHPVSGKSFLLTDLLTSGMHCRLLSISQLSLRLEIALIKLIFLLSSSVSRV